MPELPAATIAALAGALGGAVLGIAARLGRFCTLAAIEDTLYAGDRRRFRMWVLAMAVAILGVGIISALGLIDITKSFYHRQPINLVAWIIGGLMFGIGMAFCGTCAFGSLVRFGGGDLKSFTVCLVLGISAYMAVAGPTAMLRVQLLDPLVLPDTIIVQRTLVDFAGGPSSTLAHAVTILLAATLACWTMTSRRFRTSARNLIWGVIVGGTILFGWIATGWLAHDPFNPQIMRSFTFSLPPGQMLMYLMTMSGGVLTFAIASTFGVIAGSLVGAILKREFRWEAADDARETRRHVLGAFLMGTGGVFAGGCTIGQGLSAVSVTAISAPIVLASIWLGAWLGLTYLIEGSVLGTLRVAFGLAQRT
ncbi:MAG: hypothetical protein RLZ98_2337 [Pseudomonadota bacterium]|jgi:uncharacterized membrane protein YedE/YeeE